MASVAFNEKKSLANGYVFGAPVKDFGFFGIALISLATGMMGFLIATFLGILGMVIYNHNGHTADLSHSYKYGGVATGIFVLFVVAIYLGSFWIKRVFRKA